MAEEIVVYKRGEVKNIIDPKLLQLILLDDVQVALNRIATHLKKEQYQGKLDPRSLSVTDQLQAIAPCYDWPFTPWISAYFINDGPDTARLAINEPLNQFDIKPDETITLDHSHADERIRIIFYVCDAGETASVRVKGQY